MDSIQARGRYRFIAWAKDKDGARTIMELWECDKNPREWWKDFYSCVRAQRRDMTADNILNRYPGCTVEIGADILNGSKQHFFYDDAEVKSVRQLMRIKIHTRELVALEFEFEILREQRRDLERKLANAEKGIL